MMTEILLGAALGYNLAKRYLVPYIVTKYDEHTKKRKKKQFEQIAPVYPDVFKKKDENETKAEVGRTLQWLTQTADSSVASVSFVTRLPEVSWHACLPWI